MIPFCRILLGIGMAVGVTSDPLACVVPRPGAYMDRDELVHSAENIVLVRMTRRESRADGSVIYTLAPVNVLKGRAEAEYRFSSFSGEGPQRDFDGHRASIFWDKSTGRSAWPCCICGPDHTFVKGRTYLYFPDKLGAVKSAEIVDKEDDRWLKYVRRLLKRTIRGRAS
jgi:hypothetical protein